MSGPVASVNSLRPINENNFPILITITNGLSGRVSTAGRHTGGWVTVRYRSSVLAGRDVCGGGGRRYRNGLGNEVP